MSRTKMALDVVQSLRSLADSLETLVNAAVGDMPNDPTTINAATVTPPVNATPSTTTTPTQPTTIPAEKPPTLVELRAFVSQRSTPENRSKIKALLTQHGVNKLTELPEDHYAALMHEVEALR
ncbi:MAG: hypothetical protein RR505_04885 [Raoultibacter sp.]